MNVRLLKKKFPTFVKSDWKQHTNTISELSNKDIDRIINVIDSNKDKKSINEIAIVKFEELPIFITISFDDYIPLLIHIKYIIVRHQQYEMATKVSALEKYLLTKYYIKQKRK